MFCEIVFDYEEEGDDDEDMTSDVAAAAELTDDQGTPLHRYHLLYSYHLPCVHSNV